MRLNEGLRDENIKLGSGYYVANLMSRAMNNIGDAFNCFTSLS